MRRFAPIAALAAAAALAAGAAAAQDAPGTIARVTYWTLHSGTVADFEKGLQAHNAFHAEQGDPHPIHTWRVITGERAGQYLRGSFGHHWADFDEPAKWAEADDADAAANVDPFLAAEDDMRYLPTVFQEIPCRNLEY